MPVWELQGRLLLAAGMNRVDYLDDSLAFIISEMP